VSYITYFATLFCIQALVEYIKFIGQTDRSCRVKFKDLWTKEKILSHSVVGMSI